MGCCESTEEENPREFEPNQTRSCTDVFWLILYILFWFLMVLIAAFSFVYGSPIRIVNGYDSFGNTCGTSHNKKMGSLQLSGVDTTDRPYLLFYDIHSLRQSLKICVRECPNITLNKIDDINSYYKSTGNKICRYDFNYNDFTSSSIKDRSVLVGSFGPCPALPVYASTPVLNRCVPKPVKELAEGVFVDFYGLLNSWDTMEQILSDLYTTRFQLLGLAGLAFLVSLFTISILHLLASLVSYIIMILVSVASIGGTGFLWYTYFDLKHNLDKTQKSMWLLESVRNETAFLWYSIVATVITIIILLLVIVMRKRVDFLADLFKETSKCVAHLPALFLQPLFTFLVFMAFIMFWLFVILCLATSYYPDTTPILPNLPGYETSGFKSSVSTAGSMEKMDNLNITNVKKLTIVEYIDPSWVKYMWWVYFIGLIWTSEFIMGCQSMVIAGSVAHWFYRHKYKDDDHVSYATCKLIKYHMGSVAKGSLLITVFKVPRVIMMYIHEKMKYNKDKGSECASCTLKCCICCFYCLEKFIRYINHNAYTVITIDGVNFCRAARTAFEVLASHPLEVATINSIGDFILFLGKCFVTALTGSVGLYFFRLNPKLHFFAAPTLLVCIISFFIAHCILSLYEMVLDTVYLCMCQNTESAPESIQMQNLGMAPRNGGSAAVQELVVEEVPMKEE